MAGVAADPLLGVALHAVGALNASLCYTPQQKVRGWAWQTYWLAQASICWFAAPLIVAAVSIPRLGSVLRAAPSSALLLTFVLGVVYGIGGTAFGVAIRCVGYSLTYALSIGISCVLGTLTGPIISGSLRALLGRRGAGWVMSGVFIGLAGTLVCGFAGRLKDIELQKGGAAAAGPFRLGKGLVLCGVAGVFSAVYGIAINDAGRPIAEAAARFGAGDWQTNAVYPFANTGAFVTTALYCLYLARKEKTFGEFRRPVAPHGGALAGNYLLSLLTGVMWYGQFLFYGLGHVRMGTFEFSSWAIHMLMLILFSSLAGIVLREWHGRSVRTRAAIIGGLAIVGAAVLVLTYGNYLGQAPGPP